ncbi:aminotransferase class V-fold PLP-dependent enzyme [Leptotrichia sp. OH3620_COT-345]|uniref:aminotransferase class V-fold PLP-dependent enzyme n=1 Tax=Leptotrichia sp. OH3620_COT-345 TaxID=2491048 RepID=UPI000F64E84A|nr:aminotransferase class V-fold PLP-dependent enzyme [Leptotrichia sp. OH3620_COT-345]RRD40003.1 aminotransferase class V-fold PLP-dependent enzyme [Leptotrichia sp. OH3620_COT-345]
MKMYPLNSLSVLEAQEKQFRLVDIITKHMTGSEFLELGDLGLNKEINKPVKTEKVEKIIASFFNAEDCILTRGAGTQAIRWGILSSVKPNGKILVHDAPIYPTTEVNIKSMNLSIIKYNFNNLKGLSEILDDKELTFCLLQHTRQKPDDSYDLGEIIKKIKEIRKNIIILTDDNYAVMKVDKIGCELGADLSAFSTFKLLGPVGIGCLTGKKEFIEKVKKMNYSGGVQVQGYEAMEVLRGLVYAPVSLAIQAQENETLVKELTDRKKYPYIKNVFLGNAQSKVVLVEFKENIAEKLIKYAEELGALPNPVGAESKYEIPPLFYKVSGTFLKNDPTLKEKMIRINPNRSGSKTVIRILEQAYTKIMKE